MVLYEENLNENILNSAIQAIQNAEVLIVAGTSLTVYPASGLVNFFKGKNLILINKTQTSYDNIADIIINSSLGEVFKEL